MAPSNRAAAPTPQPSLRICHWHPSPSPNDFRHLRHTHNHLFTTPICRTSEYVTGTTVALALCPGSTITPEHLPQDKLAGVPAGASPGGAAPESSEELVAERRAIEAALANCAGNQTRAAEQLGISRRTLINKLAQLKIPRPRC